MEIRNLDVCTATRSIAAPQDHAPLLLDSQHAAAANPAQPAPSRCVAKHACTSGKRDGLLVTHAFQQGNPACRSKSGSSQSLGSTRFRHSLHTLGSGRWLAWQAFGLRTAPGRAHKPYRWLQRFSTIFSAHSGVCCQGLERPFCPSSKVSSILKVPVLHGTATAVTAARTIGCLRLSQPDLLSAVKSSEAFIGTVVV